MLPRFTVDSPGQENVHSLLLLAKLAEQPTAAACAVVVLGVHPNSMSGPFATTTSSGAVSAAVLAIWLCASRMGSLPASASVVGRRAISDVSPSGVTMVLQPPVAGAELES